MMAVQETNMASPDVRI